MSDYAKSLVRDLAQKAVGMLFVWLGIHVLAVPRSVKDAVANWAVLALTSLLLFAWTALVRWLETRPGTTSMDGYLRAAGKILMLGAKGLPFYPEPEKPAPQPIPSVPQVPAADQTMILPRYTPPTPTVLPSGDSLHPGER